MNNLVNTEYITLDELLDSTINDFKKYQDAGIIDKSSLYKVVAYCNANAGIRINPIVHCTIDIVNGKCKLPDNFKKIKSINIITSFKTNINTKIPDYSRGSEIVYEKPSESVSLYTPIGCIDDCGKCYWEIPKKSHIIEESIYIESFSKLNNADKGCDLSHNSYNINREDNTIEFGVNSGKAVLCYYTDLDKLGLIPKHPMLYFFYEWTLKVKILQDILMNSDDDVSIKLQYAEKERADAHVDFDNYIKSESFKKFIARYKKEEREFEEKWSNPFY